VFSLRVSGATYADGGFFDDAVVLEVFCDVLLRDEPVMCLATTGSTDMKDSSLVRDDVGGISTVLVVGLGVYCRSLAMVWWPRKRHWVGRKLS
jgi:hypothetical protein